MKKYYLDTVAVRRLSMDLSNLAGSCYTSVFSVLELLSGVSEEEYGPRKAALTKLLSSGLEIDWRLPMELILESFHLHDRPGGISASDVKAIAEELIASINYKDFMEKNKNLQPDINLLTFFDQRLSAEFKVTFLKKTNDIRDSRAEDRRTKFNPVHERGVRSLADFICQSLLPSRLAGRSADVQKNYNGSINRFIETWLGYYDLNANLLNEPSTNDWADVLHVTYLDSSTDIVFVSDDKKIRNLLNKLIPDSSVSVDDFNISKKKSESTSS